MLQPLRLSPTGLRSELFRSGAVTVLERAQMQEILKEQGFQQTGCTTDQCAVETGQLLGVKYMVVGSIGLVGHTYTLAGRLIDVSTGKMVATANVDCKCEIDDVLSRSTGELSKQLVQSFSTVQNNSPSLAINSTPRIVETGSLKIVSKPAGASVFVNDSARGTTPMKLDNLKSGQYRLRLELQGYNSDSDNVKVSTGDTVEKNYALKARVSERFVPRITRPVHFAMAFAFSQKLAGPYLYTDGFSSSLGLKIHAKNFIGIGLSVQLSNGGFATGKDQLFSGSVIYTYAFTVKDIFIAEFGGTLGIWYEAMSEGSTQGTVFQEYYGGPKIRLQIGYKHAYLFVEPTLLIDTNALLVFDSGISFIF
jgi:TolB-like protein